MSKYPDVRKAEVVSKLLSHACSSYYAGTPILSDYEYDMIRNDEGDWLRTTGAVAVMYTSIPIRTKVDNLGWSYVPQPVEWCPEPDMINRNYRWCALYAHIPIPVGKIVIARWVGGKLVDIITPPINGWVTDLSHLIGKCDLPMDVTKSWGDADLHVLGTLAPSDAVTYKFRRIPVHIGDPLSDVPEVTRAIAATIGFDTIQTTIIDVDDRKDWALSEGDLLYATQPVPFEGNGFLPGLVRVAGYSATHWGNAKVVDGSAVSQVNSLINTRGQFIKPVTQVQVVCPACGGEVRSVDLVSEFVSDVTIDGGILHQCLRAESDSECCPGQLAAAIMALPFAYRPEHRDENIHGVILRGDHNTVAGYSDGDLTVDYNSWRHLLQSPPPNLVATHRDFWACLEQMVKEGLSKRAYADAMVKMYTGVTFTPLADMDIRRIGSATPKLLVAAFEKDPLLAEFMDVSEDTLSVGEDYKGTVGIDLTTASGIQEFHAYAIKNLLS